MASDSRDRFLTGEAGDRRAFFRDTVGRLVQEVARRTRGLVDRRSSRFVDRIRVPECEEIERERYAGTQIISTVILVFSLPGLGRRGRLRIGALAGSRRGRGTAGGASGGHGVLDATLRAIGAEHEILEPELSGRHRVPHEFEDAGLGGAEYRRHLQLALNLGRRQILPGDALETLFDGDLGSVLAAGRHQQPRENEQDDRADEESQIFPTRRVERTSVRGYSDARSRELQACSFPAPPD